MMEFQFHWSFVEQFPYAFGMLSVLSKYQANVVTYQWYSIITAALFLTIAFVEFRYRKVSLG